MTGPAAPQGGTTRRVLDHSISLVFVAILALMGYEVFAPLFPAILWGVLLAVICAHPYENLVSRLRGRRHWADLIFAIVLMMVLLLPATFFAWELIAYFPIISAQARELAAGPLLPAPVWLVDLPVVGDPIRIAWGTATTDLGAKVPGMLSHLGGVATWAAGRIGTFGAFLFEFALGAVISLFILHHRFAVRAFINRFVVKVGGGLAGGLVNHALDTTRTAFTGVIVASIAQTLLAGIGLYFAGLPAVILFMGFTFLLALVQIGPLVVLVAADAILLLQGAYLAAALLAVWFIAVVMSIDNLIRPYFSSRGGSLPGIVAFLGTVGGFLTWGLIGVFLGPVLTSVLFELVLAWLAAEDIPQAAE